MATNETEESLECVRRYVVEGEKNQTKTFYFYAGYSGIPENLVLNIIMWLVGTNNNIRNTEETV